MAPKLESRQLSKLKSYPKQGCFFHELSEPDLRRWLPTSSEMASVSPSRFWPRTLPVYR